VLASNIKPERLTALRKGEKIVRNSYHIATRIRGVQSVQIWQIVWVVLARERKPFNALRMQYPGAVRDMSVKRRRINKRFHVNCQKCHRTNMELMKCSCA
jgi:hypothetical protein